MRELWRQVFVFPGILLTMLLAFAGHIIAAIPFEVIVLIDKTIAESYADAILKCADKFGMWATDGLEYIYYE